jgi:tRNA(Arg) A34 adenosine deaminase TadA
MCAGAMSSHASNAWFWADDPKAGAAGSILNIVDHPPSITGPQSYETLAREEPRGCCEPSTRR